LNDEDPVGDHFPIVTIKEMRKITRKKDTMKNNMKDNKAYCRQAGNASPAAPMIRGALGLTGRGHLC